MTCFFLQKQAGSLSWNPLRETVVDELENLIDVKDTLNISQAKRVQMVGLTGWREVVLQATDEVRLAIGLCLFS